MENHLKRVLDLAQRTGDTMIVVDQNGDEAFVVMPLSRYEQLLSKNVSFTPDHDPSTPDIWDVMKPAGEDGETWDLNQLNNQERREVEKQYQEFSGHASQESQRKASEQISNEDQLGEEQFYLEPVE